MHEPHEGKKKKRRKKKKPRKKEKQNFFFVHLPHQSMTYLQTVEAIVYTWPYEIC